MKHCKLQVHHQMSLGYTHWIFKNQQGIAYWRVKKLIYKQKQTDINSMKLVSADV